MKYGLVLITLMIQLLAPQARAASDSFFEIVPSIETGLLPSDPEQIKILGKGLLAKESRESLALGCVGENYGCDTLQFIHFKSASESQFIGPKFKVKGEKELKQMLKKLSKNSLRNTNRAVFSMLAVIGVLTAITPIVNSATPLYFAVFSPWVAGMLGMNNAYDFIGNYKLATSTDQGSFMIKQQGWNWSQDAHEIREKQFQRIVDYLQRPDGFAAQIITQQ